MDNTINSIHQTEVEENGGCAKCLKSLISSPHTLNCCGQSFCSSCLTEMLTEETCLCNENLDREQKMVINSLVKSTSLIISQSKTNMKEELYRNLECGLCLSLLCEPVSIDSCQHTFCKSCILRMLDHRPQCPNCRENLSSYLAKRKFTINQYLNKIISLHFEEENVERLKNIRKESVEDVSVTDDNKMTIPIFVCGVALPFCEFPLHVFEPRYRLMMRRAMEGTRKFGMCVHTHSGYSDIGTILYIRELQLLPDGRSFVDCIATDRFKVLSRNSRDNYNVGEVEIIKDDDLIEGEEEEIQSLFSGSRTLLSTVLGDEEANIVVPSEREEFAFWCINNFCGDDRIKYASIASKSLKHRFTFVHMILEAISSR